MRAYKDGIGKHLTWDVEGLIYEGISEDGWVRA